MTESRSTGAGGLLAAGYVMLSVCLVRQGWLWEYSWKR